MMADGVGGLHQFWASVDEGVGRVATAAAVAAAAAAAAKVEELIAELGSWLHYHSSVISLLPWDCRQPDVVAILPVWDKIFIRNLILWLVVEPKIKIHELIEIYYYWVNPYYEPLLQFIITSSTKLG